MDTSEQRTTTQNRRARWAAIGAAVAVSLGAGGIGLVNATSPEGASAFVPITPCRLADTRPAPDNVGPRANSLGTGETQTFNGWASAGGTGNCDTDALPDDTTGLELNVTALAPSRNTNLRFWPDGEAMPLSANLNPSVGVNATPNSVSVALSPAGKFNVFNFQGNVHLVIDVVGHYTDHHHDDRYYTKAQSDDRYYTTGQSDDRYYTTGQSDDRYFTKAEVVERVPTAWGMARGDGSLRAQSPNVVEVLHPGTGLYCVVFDPLVPGDRLESATISGAGSGPIMAEKTNGIGGADSCSEAPNGQGLQLRIYNENGNLSNERFGFIVP